MMKTLRNRMLKLLCTLMVAGLVASFGAGAARAQGDKLVIDGSTTVLPLAEAFREFYIAQNPGVEISVTGSGSGNGAKSLVNGTCDIADMSRPMKQTELEQAVERGIVPVPHVIALDGLAVIVHPSNPLKGLTIEQVRNIYLGNVKNWNELGGPDMPIIIISRDTNSGTFDTFEKFVMEKQKVASGVETVGSNGAVRQRVMSTPAAIGYVGLGFVDRKVKALDIAGVEANPRNVLSGRYPIGRPLFMYTNGYPELGSHLHRFVTLYLTPKGQEIVMEKGFVPLTEY